MMIITNISNVQKWQSGEDANDEGGRYQYLENAAILYLRSKRLLMMMRVKKHPMHKGVVRKMPTHHIDRGRAMHERCSGG